MRWQVGTSGFSYDAWKGSFYPEDLPARRRLAFYAERLPSVEINNTFYRLPRAAMLAGWAEQVPEDFRFALKASRRITHFSRLRETDELVGVLFGAAEALGPRLGCVLFQLPPNFEKDLERLRRFLGSLPAGRRAAFEFRHPSWHDSEVEALLREADAASCVADTEGGGPPERLPAAGSWGYLRLRGERYGDDALRAWASAAEAQGWDEAYVFFKHEDEGAGPALASRLLSLVHGEARRGPQRAARPRRPAARVGPSERGTRKRS